MMETFIASRIVLAANVSLANGQAKYRAYFVNTTLYLAYRAGVNYGFVRGYEDGHTMGVRKAFGISRDDASDMHERAIEMEMDEMLIKGLDKRKEEANK